VRECELDFSDLPYGPVLGNFVCVCVCVWQTLALIKCKEYLDQINNCQIFKILRDMSVKYGEVVPVTAPAIEFVQLKGVLDKRFIDREFRAAVLWRQAALPDS